MNSFKTLFLLSVGYHLNSCSQFLPRKYYYIDMKMSWTDARHVCRENYTDLATFENMDDINSLEPTFSYELAWIGLWDDPQSWKYAMGSESNSWRWSATNETSKTGYSNWMTNEPQHAGSSETCVAMTTDGKWNDRNCEIGDYFICYTGKKKILFMDLTY
ncbi:L-selectin-like [Larimichthys crocea]|uniref:L-selectin-like n=1 Tax=Larimichthys crocea TaxID=215358 RepID=UPI000F5FB56C|nr:L-selectin-like [Larimichthys crocea]